MVAQAYKMRDRYDNCYAEAKQLHAYEFKSCKTVSRTVQTNVLELLAVDDLMPGLVDKIKQKRKRDFGEDIVEEGAIDEADGRDQGSWWMTKDIFDKMIEKFEGF